jgi:Uma2 family endonuclease
MSPDKMGSALLTAPSIMTYTTGHAIPQSSPPRPPRETLPTMYDLPSEWPEEPGLPDEFHDLQPQLLSRTLALVDYGRENWFAASDLNLYYDVHQPPMAQTPRLVSGGGCA